MNNPDATIQAYDPLEGAIRLEDGDEAIDGLSMLTAFQGFELNLGRFDQVIHRGQFATPFVELGQL